MKKNSVFFTSPHPAHQNRTELRYWRPDPKWYHPFICRNVVNISRFILGRCNTLSIDGLDRWNALFEKQDGRWSRMNDRGLLSFSNHVSLFDDPLLLSNLGSSDVKKVRWIAADHKNFFGSNLKGLIYSSGRCVPIIRGGGLNQPGFDFLIERLRNGEWVHIFPEGGRTRDKEYRLQRDFKVGIGKLIYEANPVLMPFYHYGMHHVLPIASAIPKRGKRIQVYFGHATTVDEQWWLKRLGVPISEVEPYTAWKVAAEWTENILLELEQCVHPHGKNKSAS